LATRLERLRSAADRVPALLRDGLIAVLMVLAASGAAFLLHQAGDRRVTLIFLLPVLFSGFAGGIRAGLIAAVLSYLVYDLFVVPPIFSLFVAQDRDAIALIVFATAAIVTGLGSGALRDEQRRAEERSRTILTLLETNKFFAVTPNEAAIRQKLVESVADITGTGAVVTDDAGRVLHRAGPGADWVGGLEGELSELARAAMAQERATAVSGRFHARAARALSVSVGAAIWLDGGGRTRAARERDAHIALLLELAATALVRCRRETPAQAEAASPDR
jgi:two-component system sensor histidine kinase KdpD